MATPIQTLSERAESQSQVRPLQVCAIAYTFYQSDGRVMRYNDALAARGDAVDVIALRAADQPRVSMLAGVRVTGVQTRQVNERSQFQYLLRIVLFFFRAMTLLTWRSLWTRYDLVHVHSVPDFLVFAAWLPKLLGARIILDIHDVLPELYASKFGASKDSAMFAALVWVERLSVAFADHVITANDLWHERVIQRSARPDKVTALLNYPDRSIFRLRGRTRTDNRFIILYPGTLNRHQGLDVAIRAFGHIAAQAPNAEFHVYGSGPALPGLKELVHELGLTDRVHFRAFRPLREIAQVMENADLGIVPKRNDLFGNEAFSTKTLEFMAMGVPLIVSDTAIDRHYFSSHIVKFFRSGDSLHLAQCMLELIDNGELRASLANNAREYVETHCWDVKKKIYLDVVESLIC